MSLRITVFAVWFSLVNLLPAANFKLDVLTDGSQVYSNVTVIGANATDLYFTHSRGIGNVKLKYLPPSLQRRFNYDPKLAAEVEQEQLRDDSRFYQSIASNLANQALFSATLARKAAASSEYNLADPISDKSLLGKPAPALEADKWLGTAPSLKGKAVLLFFWAPWSIPSRRYLPAINTLQKRFADRLIVVGITADPETEIAAMDQRLEFPCAIDAKARMATAAGITSVPSVLLVDSKGLIRYQGHPAALEDRIVESLLPKAPE
jgi:thiol-disulfide isomerase/thioredoxin